ncbi:LysR family transcriptional regulator [Pontibacter sp. JAM-7]|uniref:LysR family transcriptional regulator n=1 Tax=Pontibacter sp. JAM-7 TaxID=3366581 RepID=UPI003AF8E3AF
MDTELLRTFLEVANTRHFGRASTHLCLTQSAVSFRIRQLESLVGHELFLRKRGNIMLTAAGERLLPYAESILSTWQTALQASGVAHQRQQLTLGATAILWQSCLRNPVLHLICQRPDLCLRTEEDQRQGLHRGLLESRLDMVLSFNPPKLPDIQSQKVGTFVLQLVSDQPDQSLTAMTDQDYVHLEWDTSLNLPSQQWWLPPVAPVLHTAQIDIALDYLMLNGGVALLPLVQVEAALREGRLFTVADLPPIEREIFASWLATNPDASACEDASALLCKGFRVLDGV